ncbi:hypothetical protein ACWEJ7_07375 [Streptomyces albidoflavus]
MQQAHIILAGSGGQPYRDYAFRSLAGRYRLSALLPVDPTWDGTALEVTAEAAGRLGPHHRSAGSTSEVVPLSGEPRR